uniref:AAA+ ATPase domain-containing protein n=1 Tax=Lygus hesperus TaxID=30085 RepID=A0A0A9XU62_LYGHE
MSTQVNVEVFVKLESPLPTDGLRSEVKNELIGQSVLPGSVLNHFENQLLTEHVSSIRVCEIFVICEHNYYEITNKTALDKETSFNTFFTRLSEEVPQSESIGGDDDTLAANFLPLPARYLDGLWESLVYDSNIKQEILQYSKAMLHYSKSEVDPNIINCNRVLLLHGPPGTGKTSLCKAVAQKLSIRLNSSYSQALLIEINTHSLFSKYFSESGKLVSKMFGKIKEIACDPQTLLCVLIDEVESLTHSRSASSNGSEPSDAIRVVNAVLTHLDILKSYPTFLLLRLRMLLTPSTSHLWTEQIFVFSSQIQVLSASILSCIRVWKN